MKIYGFVIPKFGAHFLKKYLKYTLRGTQLI